MLLIWGEICKGGLILECVSLWLFVLSNMKMLFTKLPFVQGNLLALQVILFQINIFCHQLAQHMTTDFVRFMKIYTNFKICFLNFLTICVNLTKLVVVFWVYWWQNMLHWQKTNCMFLKKTVIMIIYSEIKPPLCIINIWITFNELPYFQHRLDVLAWILRKLLHPQIQVVTRKCLPVVQMI